MGEGKAYQVVQPRYAQHHRPTQCEGRHSGERLTRSLRERRLPVAYPSGSLGRRGAVSTADAAEKGWRGWVMAWPDPKPASSGKK